MKGGLSRRGARQIRSKVDFLLRRWVVPTGMPGMTLQDSHDRPENAGDRATIADRFDRILAAGRREPAAGREQGADPSLVDPNQPNHQFREDSQRITSSNGGQRECGRSPQTAMLSVISSSLGPQARGKRLIFVSDQPVRASASGAASMLT